MNGLSSSLSATEQIPGTLAWHARPPPCLAFPLNPGTNPSPSSQRYHGVPNLWILPRGSLCRTCHVLCPMVYTGNTHLFFDIQLTSYSFYETSAKHLLTPSTPRLPVVHWAFPQCDSHYSSLYLFVFIAVFSTGLWPPLRAGTVWYVSVYPPTDSEQALNR